MKNRNCSVTDALVTVLATVCAIFPLKAEAGDYDAEFTRKTKFGLYKVRTASCNDGRVRLIISKNGKTLLDQTADHYFLTDPGTKEPTLQAEGKKIPTYDLRGLGEQDIVVMTWSGGAHCCYMYDMYALSNTLKHVWHHDTGDGHFLGYKKNAHGAPFLLIEDQTFRYYITNVPEMPVVVLRWQNGKFRVDRARMKTGLDRYPPLKISEVKEYLEKGSEQPLTAYVLNLYYCGKAREADQFINEVLPVESHVPTIESRADYRAGFLKQLKKSPFYADIKAINGGRL
ncbi:MAG TPA: hypothetical protein V6C76_13100 [Drouetiella sp.]